MAKAGHVTKCGERDAQLDCHQQTGDGQGDNLQDLAQAECHDQDDCHKWQLDQECGEPEGGQLCHLLAQVARHAQVDPGGFRHTAGRDSNSKKEIREPAKTLVLPNVAKGDE